MRCVALRGCPAAAVVSSHRRFRLATYVLLPPDSLRMDRRSRGRARALALALGAQRGGWCAAGGRRPARLIGAFYGGLRERERERDMTARGGQEQLCLHHRTATRENCLTDRSSRRWGVPDQMMHQATDAERLATDGRRRERPPDWAGPTGRVLIRRREMVGPGNRKKAIDPSLVWCVSFCSSRSRLFGWATLCARTHACHVADHTSAPVRAPTFPGPPPTYH